MLERYGQLEQFELVRKQEKEEGGEKVYVDKTSILAWTNNQYVVQAQRNETVWARPIVAAVGSESTPCLNYYKDWQWPSFYNSDKIGANRC